MDNPIFGKLQDAIEHPCRSKDWFGMAEQAINTIYALGEHPDELCNDLIKNLTIRAFGGKTTAKNGSVHDRDAGIEDQSMDTQDDNADAGKHGDESKDTGDAFELSQLLFVVGHVAIKHIVFLELVEREWKRQRDERQAGNLFISFAMGQKH
jgi:condensin complex subunit 1